MPYKRIACAGCGKKIRGNKTGKCSGCCHDGKAPAEPGRPSEAPAESTEVGRDTLVITKPVAARVTTLEQLLAVCEVDLAVWEVDKFVCNKWEMASVNKRAAGQVSVTEGHTVSELWQLKAWFRRRSAASLEAAKLAKGLVADIRAEVRKAPPRPVKRHEPGPWLFEFAPFDLHMGKYAWAEETVTDYDAAIAEDLFNASLDFLLQRALKLADGKIDRVLCVFGNDVSHSDSKRGQTTAGTPMDMDTRYNRIYRRICKVHRRAVDILRQVAPVDIKIVPGNHDELTAFHLGMVLEAVYENDPRVKIDNDAKLRKYYDYGVNLFGFSHGDKERVTELPLAMAREQPELWARCPSREWHIGHKHISEKWEARHGALEQDLFSDKGIRIRRLTSLSSHDSWHTQHAYMDRRAAEAFVFHKEAGFTDHLSFNVDHFTGKALAPK